jgi:hypothetical protein
MSEFYYICMAEIPEKFDELVLAFYQKYPQFIDYFDKE